MDLSEARWEGRAGAAQRLGPVAGEPEADEHLMRLFPDAEDTAVSQAAANAVLGRRDLAGLRLFATAFVLTDEDTRNKIGDKPYGNEGTFSRAAWTTLWCNRRSSTGCHRPSTNGFPRQGCRTNCDAYLRPTTAGGAWQSTWKRASWTTAPAR